MDGRVLTEALVDPAPVRYEEGDGADVAAVQGFGAEDAEQIEARLRGLGYL